MITAKNDQQIAIWMRKYFDDLYRFVMSRVNDADTAKDLLQETFIAAWKSQGSFRRDAEEKTWLFSILKNKIVDHYRKAAKNVEVAMEDRTEEGYFFNQSDHWRPETLPHSWSEHPTDRKEFYRILQDCKSKLTNIYQMVFTLKYMEDCEADHICKVLEITASNYWVILHRCKLHLRDCMEKNWLLQSK